ncbi:terminase TerL endonuclease subunit [Vreelandella titanicae]|uniref:Phage Terminase n=1 Tax=Vreelandella titanicae BH1 TaxID=1204738 RepID=L9UBM4_9GAMM|nr:terminase TerL endonuclease subunit [Halomonas titanicae]ELY22294.1 Phage Terminase [Halomonas titanicae BH1]
MSKLLTDNTLRQPVRSTAFFADERSGFPSAAHMLDSRVWFEEGKGGALELRFACRAQVVEYLCFCLGEGYLLFKQIDVVKGRSVFSAIQWSVEPPIDLGESVGWVDAGGPLSTAPEAAKEIESPGDEVWMPPEAWASALATLGSPPATKKWAAICNTDPDGLVSIVKLYKTPNDCFEVRFSQEARGKNLVERLKNSGPVAFDPWRNTREALLLDEAGVEVVEFRCTVANMSEPMQATRELVCAGLFCHAGDPMLTNHVLQVLDRCRVTSSLKRSHYPRRLQGQRIDGALALIMAVGLALDESRQPGEVNEDD